MDFSGPKCFHSKRLKYFNAVVSSVACFGSGHRDIYNSQLVSTPAQAVPMGTPRPIIQLLSEAPLPPPGPPAVSEPAPKELRRGFSPALHAHPTSRRYKNGIAWKLPSKTVIHSRPSARKRCGEKKMHVPKCSPVPSMSELCIQPLNFPCPNFLAPVFANGKNL